MKRFAIPLVAFCESGDTAVTNFFKLVINIHANTMLVVIKKISIFEWLVVTQHTYVVPRLK